VRVTHIHQAELALRTRQRILRQHPETRPLVRRLHIEQQRVHREPTAPADLQIVRGHGRPRLHQLQAMPARHRDVAVVYEGRPVRQLHGRPLLPMQPTNAQTNT